MTFWPMEPSSSSCRPARRRLPLGRVLLAAYVLLALIALLGNLGRGLPQRAQPEEDTLAVQHQLLLRADVEHRVDLHIAPEHLRARRVSVAIDRRYMEAMELKGTAPQLLGTRFDGERVILDFPVEARGRPLVVQLVLRTLRAGAPAGEIAVVGGPVAHVRHFVSP